MYELLPSQFEVVNGKKKCVERSVKYIADFQYTDKNGNLVVEDVKTKKKKKILYLKKIFFFLKKN